jgi:(E)-4-hydroxy-3-methylbut-2-enyl-diphosphate synthase
VKSAKALAEIRRRLRADGIEVPLVADIHFHPNAAMEAVKHVEKVRVNPGNFADSKKFAVKEYTDQAYADEVRRVQERFRPLVKEALERNVALRIGTNHGSLSDRIMNRFGDTALGMVESAMEFVYVCEEEGHRDTLFSMKASNPQVMIQAYRLLAVRLADEGLDHPFHLGVTEAGEGEDGRIKSALGIGSLLRDGIGDTVRVSLTESPVRELPVARRLVELAGLAEMGSEAIGGDEPPFDPFETHRRIGRTTPYGVHRLGAGGPVVALISLPTGLIATEAGRERVRRLATPPEPGLPALEGVLLRAEDAEHAPALRRAVPGLAIEIEGEPGPARALSGPCDVPAYRALVRDLAAAQDDTPIILHAEVSADRNEAALQAASTVGALLADGIGDAVRLAGDGTPEDLLDLTLSILQAARLRSSRTEYIACPGCGRTLFDLETTTQRIKERTGHLPGVKIAVMGCIVNGPGEMADADFGYVGAAPGKVNLYVGKEIVVRGVDEQSADDRLVQLLQEQGVWRDVVSQAVAPQNAAPQSAPQTDEVKT